MKTPSPSLVISALAFVLVAAAPAAAATPNAVLKSQLRVQKAKVAKLKAQLKAQLGTANATITTLNGQVVTLTESFAQSQTDLAKRTAERDAANAALTTTTASLAAQTALTTSAATGALAGLSPDQLWAVLGALYPLMPNSDLCGYGRSFYASGNYTSYSFTRYVC